MKQMTTPPKEPHSSAWKEFALPKMFTAEGGRPAARAASRPVITMPMITRTMVLKMGTRPGNGARKQFILVY